MLIKHLHHILHFHPLFFKDFKEQEIFQIALLTYKDNIVKELIEQEALVLAYSLATIV